MAVGEKLSLTYWKDAIRCVLRINDVHCEATFAMDNKVTPIKARSAQSFDQAFFLGIVAFVNIIL